MAASTTPRTSMQAHPIAEDLAWFVSQIRPRRLRSMRAFSEQEIIIPAGPFAGRRFRCARQPFVALWFDEVDSGRWSRYVATGPTQSGKTLSCFVIPLLYHLFEIGETVICGLPDMDMASDKWREDILPVIERCRFKDLLPRRGGGSRGGRVETIQFGNGATLKFMSGGGSDKSRAGFTSRIVVITETDGLDTAGSSSREADKINQLAARTHAFGDRARIYMECTVSTEQGRTWREIKAGTDSRIVLPCPHCHQWITPEREHLVGWSEAADVVEAGAKAMLVCAKCGAAWSEADRAAANRDGRLVHRGQEIDEQGNITGALPGTRTLGFRFTAANNLLMSMAHVAEEEWEAPRTTDPELAEKKLRQFFWALPSEPEAITLSQIDAAAIAARVVKVERGRVPGRPRTSEYPDGRCPLTVGIDIGKWLCHWVAVAWGEQATPHVLDYGRLEVPSASMAEEIAIATALRQFRDEVLKTGWLFVGGAVEGASPNVVPRLVVIDSGHWEAAVVRSCIESGAAFIPSKGFGVQQLSKRRLLGDPGYELVPKPGHRLLELNADHWKGFVHSRLQTPAGQAGGLTLFHAQGLEHLSFAKHLTAERRVEEFIAGKGLVSRWEAVNRHNHWLDALALACVAGHLAGQRIVVAEASEPAEARPIVRDQRGFRPYRPDDEATPMLAWYRRQR